MGEPSEFEVEEFAFIGRTFEEYKHMFHLDTETLADRTILDCPAGPDSFVARAHERGASVTGVDMMYDLLPDELAQQCRRDYEAVAEQLTEKRDLFTWEFYDTVENRKRLLRNAYETFLDDYAEGRHQDRYVYAELPNLPFADNMFSLVLSGHFLFLYDDQLDYDFHRQTLHELVRVASDEVRVFPLVGLDTERYNRLDDLIADLTAKGYTTDIQQVPFEFQQGATEMLVVTI